MGIEYQVLWLLSWLVLLKFLQVSLHPLLAPYLGRQAYPVSFTAGILGFTVLSWYLGLLGLPVALAALPFLVLLGWALFRDRYRWEDLRPELRWDLVFFAAFAVLLVVRLANPAIWGAEKFMDHAFIASIMRSPVVPPPDPWYAGGTLNVYYYGGYWMMGVLGILTNVPSPVVFNLALPTIFALAAVNLYAIGDLLLPRFRWFPLLTLVLVNPAFLQDLLFAQPAGGILWDSTRVITNTINEYTLFSFLWGDVHPHVLDIANQVFLLLLLSLALTRWFDLGKHGKAALAALAALSLGSMPVVNTWDVLVYAPLTVITALLLLWDGWRRGGREGSSEPDLERPAIKRGATRDLSPLGLLLVVPPLAVLLYFPYYLQMATTGFLGIFPVTAPSDPGEFLLVHGFFLAVFFMYGAVNVAGRRPLLLVAVLLPSVLVAAAGYPAAAIALAAGAALAARWERRPETLFALAGIAIILFTEAFFLKDYLGGIYYRMNTVFKFYNIAWILMGIAAMVILARVLGDLDLPRFPAVTARAAAILSLVLVLLALPAFFIAGGGSMGPTLDGLQYLGSSHPGDARALPFVRLLPPGTVIAEGVKGDYDYPSRISAFTGVQTILGWTGHEFMWRGAAADTGGRAAEVKAVYEDPARAPGILRKYNVTHVYVGDTERQLYPRLALPYDHLVPVYTSEGVTIYRFSG